MSSFTFAKSACLFFFFLFLAPGSPSGESAALAPGSALICQDWGEDMGEDIPCPQTVSAHMFFQSAMARLMQDFIFHQIQPPLKWASLFVYYKPGPGLNGVCQNLQQLEANFVQLHHVN